MADLRAMWEVHKDAEWPRFSSPHEGELMMLDTVISGCVVCFLDTPAGFDLQRVEMLGTCLADLDAILPELPGDSREYFDRLRALGGILLEAHPHG